MSWISAELGTIGRMGQGRGITDVIHKSARDMIASRGMGDMDLAGTCVPAPTDINPQRVICGGIMFANRGFAMTWPGASLLEDYPTVHSDAQGHQLFTPMFFGRQSRETPLSSQLPVGDASRPAATPAEAAATGRDMGPVTLVAPLPSITPPRDPLVSSDELGVFCHLNSWVTRNPLLALAGLWGLYAVLKGGNR